ALRTDWVAVAEELVATFAARAAGHDADDTFVSENYADLRRRRLFSAAVPVELGGGGASPSEMCEVLRTLAHGCSSTALALSMHTRCSSRPGAGVRNAHPSSRSCANQLKAGAILEKVYAEQPNHPGVAHYIIHSYDYPPLAARGL